MIVKNEARNLKELLPSVKNFADEIVVVDTGSDDNTVEIAKTFTPNVYYFPWCDDFSAARNFSLSKASGNYFLWLDADDRISDKAILSIKELKKYFNSSNFFYMILKDIALTDHGPKVRSYTYQIRCAPLLPGVKFQGKVHERLLENLPSPPFRPVTTDIEIEHYGYNDPILLKKKMLRNLRLMTMDYEHYKSDPAFIISLAVTYYALKNYSKAYLTIKNYIETNYSQISENYFNSSFDIYVTAAEYAYTSDVEAEAIRWLIRAEACVRPEKACIFRLAKMWEKLGDHRKAIGYLLTSLNMPHKVSTIPTLPPPEEWELSLRLAYNYICLGDKETYRKFVASATNVGGISREDAYEWLSTHAFYLKNFQIAQLVMEDALAEGCATPSILCNLGILYRKYGNMAKAEEYLRKSLAMNPQHIVSRINLGWVYLAKGEYEKSFKVWSALLRNGIDDWDVVAGGIVSGIIYGADIENFIELLTGKAVAEVPYELRDFEISKEPIGLLEALIKTLQLADRSDLVPYVTALRRFILKPGRKKTELR